MATTSRFVIRATVGLLAVGFLTLLGIVATTIWLGQRAHVYFEEVIEARETRGSAVELRDAVQTAESSQRGFLMTGNEIYLAPYDRAKTVALRQLDRLKRSHIPQPQAEEMLDRLARIVTDKIHEMDRTIALKNDRRDDELLALVRTNRGKALMDEANVFLSGIIEAADDRLTRGVSEQRANAAMLRRVSTAGGVLIVLVVGAATVTIARYAREVVRARDEVRALNAGLEERVAQRTADLAAERDRAEVLLAEVNHRVANSLSLVAALVKLQSTALTDQGAKQALEETEARIHAVASVHKRLYGSSDVRVVSLDEYLAGLLDQLAASMRERGLGASLRYELEPVTIPTDASINLGVVVTEWVTNAFKYAYPGGAGEIRVRLKQLGDARAELVVDDDGVGREVDGPVKGTGLGTRIAKAMATTMGAQIEYLGRRPGTTARLVFPLRAA